ncbi:hypothetical protein ElyMa_005749700 [Elysia marginata]|uniref:Uncharacterized protein n=1 Tax=Elysia marginata TaxID=1093978 RepID=A0AAV4FMZ0_9GAST|nr:hypothetical protein ElyMa_005749700 [Elysia marginata]
MARRPGGQGDNTQLFSDWIIVTALVGKVVRDRLPPHLPSTSITVTNGESGWLHSEYKQRIARGWKADKPIEGGKQKTELEYGRQHASMIGTLFAQPVDFRSEKGKLMMFLWRAGICDLHFIAWFQFGGAKWFL